jgi:ribonuclease R
VFSAARIKSHGRLTYGGVSAWLESKGRCGPRLGPDVAKGLLELNALTDILLAARAQRGALDFDRVEHRLSLTPEGVVQGVVQPERTRAHRIVEECMVTANVAAARFLRDAGLPLLSRFHAAPLSERLSPLLSRAPEAKVSTPAEVAQLLAQRPELLPFIRAATGAAEYSPDQSGHFGLALEEYAHFTSPIRRYPDLLVHRALHVALGNLGPEALDEHWVTLGQLVTERERAATGAERAATDLLRMEWLSRQVSQSPDALHEGIVDGTTPAGVFLTLASNGASGLLRPPAGSQYVAARKAWRLADGQEWSLGDRLQVQVAAVDVPAMRLSFVLPPSPTAEPVAGQPTPSFAPSARPPTR